MATAPEPTSADAAADVLRLLADLLPVIVRITDLQGQVIYFNGQWTRTTGLTVASGLGDGWRQALHPDDVAAFEATSTQGRTGRIPYTVQYRLRGADGAYR